MQEKYLPLTQMGLFVSGQMKISICHHLASLALNSNPLDRFFISPHSLFLITIFDRIHVLSNEYVNGIVYTCMYELLISCQFKEIISLLIWIHCVDRKQCGS